MANDFSKLFFKCKEGAESAFFFVICIDWIFHKLYHGRYVFFFFFPFWSIEHFWFSKLTKLRTKNPKMFLTKALPPRSWSWLRLPSTWKRFAGWITWCFEFRSLYFQWALILKATEGRMMRSPLSLFSAHRAAAPRPIHTVWLFFGLFAVISCLVKSIWICHQHDPQVI